VDGGVRKKEREKKQGDAALENHCDVEERR
jgi:hypothetical protein